MLPAEIAELVKGLEGHIKKEKEESSEVAKYSQRTLNKIKENASSLEILIRSLKVHIHVLNKYYKGPNNFLSQKMCLKLPIRF